jgi:hypothetical protein
METLLALFGFGTVATPSVDKRTRPELQKPVSRFKKTQVEMEAKRLRNKSKRKAANASKRRNRGNQHS